MRTTAPTAVWTPVSLVCAVLVAGCARDAGPKDANIAAPDDPNKIIRTELLTKPDEDVLVAGKKAADFAELKVTTVKEGEGEDVLDYGEIGKFHVSGTLANGKRFLNTRGTSANTRGSSSPIEIYMVEGGDVQGIILGCVGMKKGERRSLLVPPSLGFGDRGDPFNGVRPGASLIYLVELVEFADAIEKGFLVRRKKAGEGDAIRVGQSGAFHYTGVLADGENKGLQFDSSLLRGQPLSLRMDINAAQIMGAPPQRGQPPPTVIRGWSLGLIGMRVGEKRWLKIPAKLAYGSRGQGADIGPGATLVFEIEMVGLTG